MGHRSLYLISSKFATKPAFERKQNHIAVEIVHIQGE